MFGIENKQKTAKQNDSDYERYWKHDGYALKPSMPYYWPGWTSKLMGKKPRPISDDVNAIHNSIQQDTEELDDARTRQHRKNLRQARELHTDVYDKVPTEVDDKVHTDVYDKDLSLYLNTICPDSGGCFAFGIEKKRLLFFFKFNSFKYAKPLTPIISKSSINAIVREIHYERNGYNAYAVLKMAKSQIADNLAYEYAVGEYINTVSSLYPVFIDTYGLFANKEITEIEDISKYLRLDDIKTDDLKLISIYDEAVCNNPMQLSILIQHIKGARTLETMMKDQTFLDEEMIYALFQIYFTLNELRDKYTHYDLHAQNVLVYEPVVGGYIDYHFNKYGLDISFKSRYMVKIIDYGRCFFPGATSYYKYLCKEGGRCGVCNNASGEFKGIWLNKNPTEADLDINSYYKNESYDLMLLDYCRNYLNTNPSQNGTPSQNGSPLPTYYSPDNTHTGVMNPSLSIPDNLQVLFNMLGEDRLLKNSKYKTRKEDISKGLHTIKNVNDAWNYLMYVVRNKSLNNHALKFKKIGDLNVYTDRPMEYKEVSLQDDMEYKTDD